MDDETSKSMRERAKSKTKESRLLIHSGGEEETQNDGYEWLENTKEEVFTDKYTNWSLKTELETL